MKLYEEPLYMDPPPKPEGPRTRASKYTRILNKLKSRSWAVLGEGALRDLQNTACRLRRRYTSFEFTHRVNGKPGQAILFARKK